MHSIYHDIVRRQESYFQIAHPRHVAYRFLVVKLASHGLHTTFDSLPSDISIANTKAGEG